MWHAIEVREQQAQILHEHRSGDLGIGFTARGKLVDEDENPIQHQDGERVFYLCLLAYITDLIQSS